MSAKQDTKKDPNMFTIANARLSFPKLFKAEGFNGSEENKKYSANFILDEEHAKKIAEMQDRIMEMQKERKQKVPSDKICLRDTFEHAGYENAFGLVASNTKRPQILRGEAGKNVPVSEEDAESMGILYAGCYVDVVVRLWFQDNKYGKRINASLEIVRFRKHGEPFGAPAANADELLDDLPEDDEDDSWMD